MAAEIKVPKKLIEVALPLDKINAASAREKSIRHGHPSTLHLWWARRPLATARAVVFAQMVNDPGYERGLGRGINKEKARIERERLFEIIERLVKWENSNNDQVLQEAREEIWKSWRETCALNADHPRAKELFSPEKLPAFHDPFAGGGAIPLEAQRLGLEAVASDLNPVAVTLNKAMVEIPPKFFGSKPVGPPTETQDEFSETWLGCKGLAEDVRRYGFWLRNEAEKHIGSAYPLIEITKDMARDRNDLKPLIGKKLTVISWLWARTVMSPNPAFSHVEVPLSSTFVLSQKPGNEAYVEPYIERDTYRLIVKTGSPPPAVRTGTKAGGSGTSFLCLMSRTPIDFKYVREEAKQGRMGQKLVAIVAMGEKGRIFLSPSSEHEEVAKAASPLWRPESFLPAKALGFRVQEYGMLRWCDLFTSRQILALTTFSDLVSATIEKVRLDAVANGMKDDGISLDSGGSGATAYAEALGVYLSLAIGKSADYWSTICFWHNGAAHLKLVNTFARQAIPMTWDFAEGNPFSESSGNFFRFIELISEVIEFATLKTKANVQQADAQTQCLSQGRVVSTDPPYYDNIGYADLSDFFYIWLSRSLRGVYPQLFAQQAVPKTEELIASPFRHGSKSQAETFFLEGMKKAMTRIAEQAHPAFPVTIYYAFKQSETDSKKGTSNSGWETFLEAVLQSGFSITGTWPVRTELVGNLKKRVNALASSVVLVCTKRPAKASSISRREFIRELNTVLPDALEDMTRGSEHSPVAPVDLSQAIIGPGMAIFSKYSAVLEADGKPMSVKTALQLINRFFAEEDFDHDTQFCLSWFDGHGWDKGKFGEADVLARAKGTSVDGLRDGGVVESAAGSLRLLRPAELPEDWQLDGDSRISVWELLHHMIRRLNNDGESGAGEILVQASLYAETIRTLAYRLYTLCERKGWAQDAGHYNALVLAWDAIETSAQSAGYTGSQASLFGDEFASQGASEGAKKMIKKRTRKKT